MSWQQFLRPCLTEQVWIFLLHEPSPWVCVHVAIIAIKLSCTTDDVVVVSFLEDTQGTIFLWHRDCRLSFGKVPGASPCLFFAGVEDEEWLCLLDRYVTETFPLTSASHDETVNDKAQRLGYPFLDVKENVDMVGKEHFPFYLDLPFVLTFCAYHLQFSCYKPSVGAVGDACSFVGSALMGEVVTSQSASGSYR